METFTLVMLFGIVCLLVAIREARQYKKELEEQRKCDALREAVMFGHRPLP